MKNLIGLSLLFLSTVGMTACFISPKQDIESTIGQIKSLLPLQFGHGLQLSQIEMSDGSLCLNVDCDTVDCLLPDSLLRTENFNMWLLKAEQDFYQSLLDEKIPVCITYKRGLSEVKATFTTSQITNIVQQMQDGTYKPISLIELTSYEFNQLKTQLPRMEGESLCLYDVFIKDKEITFIYIYPEEVTSESLALTNEDLDEMKRRHSDGLRQSYSVTDLEAFKTEGVVFVYKYVTPNELLCTVKVPAEEIH